MKATMKKVKDGRWFVSIEGYDVTAVFDENEHDEALISAYNEGCDDFEVRYSPRVMRAFTRESIENFVIKKA